MVVCCGFRCLHWSDFIVLLQKILLQPQLLADLKNFSEHLAEIKDSVETIAVILSILEGTIFPVSIEEWRKTIQGREERPPLELLLMTSLRS